MAEINVKSPALKNREISTYKFDATVTVGGACACITEAIDIAGLTVATTAATTFTLSGFEAESDFALDSSRRAGVVVKATGTVAGATDAEIGSLSVVSAVVSGTAGSRVVTVTVDSAANAVTLLTDSMSNAVLEFSLPIKQKDF